MDIRTATPSDREAIRETARETWHQTYDELDATTIDKTVDDWYEPEEFEETLTNPGTVFLVAEIDGEVAGFLHAVVLKGQADILRIYVRPDYQGQGVGTALHERMLDTAEEEVERVRAIDLASNEHAREFFEAKGFEAIDTGSVTIRGENHEEVVYAIEL